MSNIDALDIMYLVKPSTDNWLKIAAKDLKGEAYHPKSIV
jgi:hypothetical protein